MKLYLVQHAEAKTKEEDPEQPLSDKGRADIGRVAAYLAEHVRVKIGRILHSGKARARQTAEVLAEHLIEGAVKEGDYLEPLADSTVWAERLEKKKEDMMLVGHLPHLSRLASRLLRGDGEGKIIDFKMGGVVCLERDEARSWAIQWMLVPEIVAWR